jgi:hypothetical protein
VPASPEPNPTHSRTPAPTTSPEPTPQSAPSDPVGFVQNYYSLLPGNTAAAWNLLSPTAQDASGGRSGFESFYGRMQSVSLENIRQTGDDTVEATVVFAEQNGRTTREPYRFVISTDGNERTIMESFSKA